MSRALLLVGSPKPERSASQGIGEALTSRLEALGWETSSERVLPTFGSTERMDALLRAITLADLVVLSFPMYIDTLPAPVMRLLETWADVAAPGSGKRLVVLAQCGFPEARQLASAVDVCRRFADQAGLEWTGHLAFGCGPSIEGRRLEKSPLAGRLAHLDAAAAALTAGEAIPPTATDAFAKPLMAPRVYPLIGAVMWLGAKLQGCREPIALRRYPQ